MAKQKETEISNNGNEAEYGEWLKENHPEAIADADDFRKDGIPILQPPTEKHTNASLLASVPAVRELYEKKERDKGILLDLMNRTNFHNRQEMIYFLDWIDWCEDFGLSLEGPTRYCVAVNSEGGLAREQYRDAITTMRFKGYGNNQNRNKPKNQLRDEGLS